MRHMLQVLTALALLALAAPASATQALEMSLAAGDFDGDLAIGVPGEDFPIATNGGKIIVIRGGLSGLNTVGVRAISQDTNPIADQVESPDEFGSPLASANFNGDAYDDLVIAALFEGVGTVSTAGLVNVIYGSLTGLDAAGNQAISQDTPGVAESFNGDGKADLAIGVPFEDRTNADHGGANLLYGSATGITVTGNVFAY